MARSGPGGGGGGQHSAVVLATVAAGPAHGPALRLPGKRPGVVEIELKFFFRASELMVEPSRSCKKIKIRRDFPRLHPPKMVCDSSNPLLILIGPLPLRLPHPSEMISIFI